MERCGESQKLWQNASPESPYNKAALVAKIAENNVMSVRGVTAQNNTHNLVKVLLYAKPINFLTRTHLLSVAQLCVVILSFTIEDIVPIGNSSSHVIIALAMKRPHTADFSMPFPVYLSGTEL